jgi:hypothetical protein
MRRSRVECVKELELYLYLPRNLGPYAKTPEIALRRLPRWLEAQWDR